MSNFWSVVGAAAGATIGAIADELDKRERVVVVERPSVRVRVSASPSVETVRLVKEQDISLRGTVVRTFGFCPDYYVVIKELEDGRVYMRRLLSKDSTMLISGTHIVTKHMLDNDYVYVRKMSAEEFDKVAFWL